MRIYYGARSKHLTISDPYFSYTQLRIVAIWKNRLFLGTGEQLHGRIHFQVIGQKDWPFVQGFGLS
jgi:hypothetical protein